ncbi:hypothetical protein K505DRAFT_331097 [Melanomma pulvis-pyrius CBS 109.77]|uniref:Uncharacterized protein n=1 Tax=Melanomma pulvis-pyrius CBS 109.77 TaxID=1314802 RepID=A0A6A6XXQ6_9PLEO|nr:hypothetical protein K505DRAFT_331097 [Melanomma pulvis-pyrius CBS 109.77]
MAESNPDTTPQTGEKAIDTVRRVLLNCRPIFQSIRNTLGEEWDQYFDCIQEILKGLSRSEDVSDWAQALLVFVDSHPEISDDHSGIVFLFNELDIDLSPRSE